jgi:hypothetical protein
MSFKHALIGILALAAGCSTAPEQRETRRSTSTPNPGTEPYAHASMGQIVIQFREPPTDLPPESVDGARGSALITARSEDGRIVKSEHGDALWLPAGRYEITVEGDEPGRFWVDVVAGHTTYLDLGGVIQDRVPADYPPTSP